MKYRVLNIVIAFFLFFSVFSCGYQFRGGGELPRGIKDVRVDIFENRTEETGLEAVITNGVIYEFTKNGRLAPNGSPAGGTLSGILKSMTVVSVSRKSEDVSIERRLTLIADLKLVNVDGEVIWTASGISDTESYSVSKNSSTTRDNKQKAILALSVKFAERVFTRITDTF